MFKRIARHFQAENFLLYSALYLGFVFVLWFTAALTIAGDRNFLDYGIVSHYDRNMKEQVIGYKDPHIVDPAAIQAHQPLIMAVIILSVIPAFVPFFVIKSDSYNPEHDPSEHYVEWGHELIRKTLTDNEAQKV